MGIYERVKELYEKAEGGNAEERATQQRETELWRDASRAAGALHAHGVKPADGRIRGWLIHQETLPPPLISRNPEEFYRIPTSTTVRYQLGADGKIYWNEKPIEHPTNAEIDTVEQYLADFVVKNHLDPELFKNDDT